MAFGRNYLALREMDEGCNICEDGYISLRKTDSLTIYYQMVCSFSTRLNDGEIN